MKVTFRAEANVLGYRAGQVYTEELTPILKAVLLNDVNLRLIDPPTLEVRRPETEDEDKKTTKSGKKPVENTDKENTDGNNPEREEDI